MGSNETFIVISVSSKIDSRRAFPVVMGTAPTPPHPPSTLQKARLLSVAFHLVCSEIKSTVHLSPRAVSTGGRVGLGGGGTGEGCPLCSCRDGRAAGTSLPTIRQVLSRGCEGTDNGDGAPVLVNEIRPVVSGSWDCQEEHLPDTLHTNPLCVDY